MTGTRWSMLLILAAVGLTGCQGGPSKKILASAEPALSPPVEGGTTVVEAPSKTVTFVERHPLLSKPRDYYESSGTNAVVKTAAAVVVGVPVGVVSEIRQIVVGAPPTATVQ